MQITNIKQLRDSLIDNYEKTKKKEMPFKMCKELTNTAGKIINSLQLELVQNQLLKETKPIKFLMYDEEKEKVDIPYEFFKGLPNKSIK